MGLSFHSISVKVAGCPWDRKDSVSPTRVPRAAVAALLLLSGVSVSWVSARSRGEGVGDLPETSADLGAALPACGLVSAFPFLSEETHSAPLTVLGSCLILSLVCVCVSSSEVVFTACSSETPFLTSGEFGEPLYGGVWLALRRLRFLCWEGDYVGSSL